MVCCRMSVSEGGIMIFSSDKLGPELCDFNVHQAMLIRNRLKDYRSARKRSWRNLVDDIINLTEHPKLTALDKERLLKRYRYYLSLRSTKGRKKPSQTEIRDAFYTIGKDTLIRWAGASNNSDTSSLSPYDMAAIRDLLLVYGFITHRELDDSIDDCERLADLFNQTIGNKSNSAPMPQFLEKYIGFSIFEDELIASQLEIELHHSQWLLQISLRQTRFLGNDVKYLHNVLEKKSSLNNANQSLSVGWVPLHTAPFLTAIINDGISNQAQLFTIGIQSFKDQEASFLSFGNGRSFTVKGNRFFPEDRQAKRYFVPEGYEAAFEYFKEKLYTQEHRVSHFYKETKRRTMKLINKNSTGQEFYEFLEEKIKHRKLGKYHDEVLGLIRGGIDTSYIDPKTGRDGLILVSGSMGSIWVQIVEAFLDREDTNYLVVDHTKNHAGSYAFVHNHSGNLSDILRERMVAQADEEGVNLQELLGFGHPETDFTP